MAGKRNMMVMGVGAGEFLVQADDGEEGVRAGLSKLLPNVSFELKPLDSKKAAAMKARLTDYQVGFISKIPAQVGVTVGRAPQSFQLSLSPETRLAASANKSGVFKFTPEISQVKRPLGGGIGPVGITVGVGIAGKF